MPVPLEIFCCYAREDQEMLVHLKTHLMSLQRSGQITIWSDVNLSAGAEWEKELHQHLESADIILLLISPDFMASDYCYSNEMERAIERHKQDSAQVIPLLLRPVHWEDAPFAHLQIIPTNAEPVTRWSNRDDAFHDTVKHIRQVITNIRIKCTLLEAGEHTKAIHYQEALACYEYVLRLDEANGSALFGKARTLFLLGQIDASIEAFTLAEQIAPVAGENFFSQLFKARALGQQERYDESLEAYDRALSFDPDHADIYSEQATILIKQQAYEKALSSLEQARQLKPENVEYVTQTGDLLFRLRLYEQALAMYGQASILQPEEASHRERQGRILTYLQHYEDAIAAYQQALAILPQPQYYDQIGKLFLEEARNQEAVEIYEQAIQATTEEHASLYLGKGQALCQLGRYDEALTCYQIAITLKELETHPRFYQDLGKLHERLAQRAYAMAQHYLEVKQPKKNDDVFFAPQTFDPLELTLLQTLNVHGSYNGVQSLAFYSDSKTLISSSNNDGELEFWEIPSGRLLRTLKSGGIHIIYDMAISLDDKTLAFGGTDELIRLWDLLYDRPQDTLVGHEGHVMCVVISPDGKLLVSGSDDHTIQLWELSSSNYAFKRKTLTGHTSTVYSVAFSPDGSLLASSSDDQTIKLWEVDARGEGWCLSTLEDHRERIRSVAFSPDGKFLASGSNDQTIKLWDLSDSYKKPESKTLTGHTDVIRSVAFSPNGKFLASGSNDQTIKLWEVASGREVRTLTGHTGIIYRVAFSPDEKFLASGSGDQTIKLWGMKP